MLFLASATQDSHLTHEENSLLERGIAARTMLVLADAQGRQDSTDTAAQWLKVRLLLSGRLSI